MDESSCEHHVFHKGTRPYKDLFKDGGSTRVLIDSAANEKAVHAEIKY